MVGMTDLLQRASCECAPGLACAECVDTERRAAIPREGDVIDVLGSNGCGKVRVTRVEWSRDRISATVHVEPA